MSQVTCHHALPILTWRQLSTFLSLTGRRGKLLKCSSCNSQRWQDRKRSPKAQVWSGDKNSIPLTAGEGPKPAQSLKSGPFTRTAAGGWGGAGEAGRTQGPGKEAGGSRRGGEEGAGEGAGGRGRARRKPSRTGCRQTQEAQYHRLTPKARRLTQPQSFNLRALKHDPSFFEDTQHSDLLCCSVC